MEKLRDVMLIDLPIGEEVKEVAGIAKLHLAAAQTVLNTQVRVDEARLRRQNVDILPEIAKILAEEKIKRDRLIQLEAAQ